MRSVALLLCLGLAACAGGGFPGAPPALEKPAVTAAPASSVSAAAAQAAADPDAPNPTDDPVIKARADCWMKVEGQRALRGIDQRIGFVDRCVADQLRHGPKS